MAFTAAIKITQGPNTDAFGNAVFGTLTDGGVSFTSQVTGGPTSYTWAVVDAPPGSNISTGVFSSASSAAFVQPNKRGGYLIGLTVGDGVNPLNDVTVYLAFVIKEVSGRWIPPFAASDLALTFAGDRRGWSTAMEQWLRYVDAIPITNVAPAPALVATSNVAQSGDQIVDGVHTNTLPVGAIVLCPLQTNPVQNGPKVINNAGAWTDPSWYNSDTLVAAQLGQLMGAALGGVQNIGKRWYQQAGNAIAGAKTFLPASRPIAVNVKEAPWFLKGDGTNEETQIQSLFAYLRSLGDNGISTFVEFPSGIYRFASTIRWPRFCSAHGSGIQTYLSLGAYGQVPQDAIRFETVLNAGGGHYGVIHNLTVENQTCSWSLSGNNLNWAPSHTYVSGDVGKYFHTRKPSNILLKLVTAGTSGPVEPIGELTPSNVNFKQIGQPASNLLVALRFLSAGYFGTCTYQVTIDGGFTWGATQTPPSADFHDYQIAASPYHGTRLANNNWPLSGSAVVSAPYTQVGVGSSVTVFTANAAAFSTATHVYIDGAGVYSVTSAVFSTLTLVNTTDTGNTTSGTIPAGAIIKAVTNGSFVMPAVDPSGVATVTATMGSTVGCYPLGYVNIPGAGLMEIVSLTATSLTLRNTGAAGNAAGGATVSVGSGSRKAVQSLFPARPRIEVIGTPPAADYIVDLLNTSGILGTMKVFEGHASNADPFKFGYSVAPDYTGYQSTAGAFWDYTLPGLSGALKVRLWAGIYVNLQDFSYFTPGYQWSGMVDTLVNDGSCVWQICYAPAAINLAGAGFLSFDSVSTAGGNAGMQISQSEAVTIDGTYQFANNSLAGLWVSNSDARMGEAGQFANGIRLGGAGVNYGEGFGLLHDGGLGFTLDGTFNFQYCGAGWARLAGIFGGSLGGFYIETAGGKMRNMTHCLRNPACQGVVMLHIDGCYGGSTSPIFDCYGASFVAQGIEGGAAPFTGLAQCTATITGISTAAPMVDAAPLVGTIQDQKYGTCHAGLYTMASRPIILVNGANSGVLIGSGTHNITGPTAAFSITSLQTPVAPFMKDGCRVRLTWSGAFPFTITNGSGIKTKTGSDVTIPAFSSAGFVFADFEYLGSSWYLLDYTPTQQSGTVTLVAGVSAAIPAVITATSVITWGLKTPGNKSLTTEYAALGTDRTTGVAGSFKLTALLAAGTINTADTSTLDWTVTNP